MSEQREERNPCLRKCTAATALLVLVNVVLVAFGIGLVVFAVKLDESGWLKALYGSDYDWIAHQIVWILCLVAGVVMLLALIGIVGAVNKMQLLLLVYGICMVIGLAVVLVLMIMGFVWAGVFHSWKTKDFPAAKTETTIGNDFNEIYCYALGGYFCNMLTVQKALDIFLPNASSNVLTALASLPQGEGVASLCSNITRKIPGFGQVCDACDVAQSFSQYDNVLQWIQDKCPAQSDPTLWCGKFLVTSKQGPVYDNSPYEQCRHEFLVMANHWSLWGAWICLGIVLWTGLLVAATFSLWCRSKRAKKLPVEQSEEADDEEEGNAMSYEELQQ